MSSDYKPPVARREVVASEWHGRVLRDAYGWMRQRDDPAVLAHLEAENAHSEKTMAPVVELRETIYQEFRARIPENDVSVPVRRGRYLYGERLVKGAQYPRFWRRPADDEASGGGGTPVGESAGSEAKAAEEVLLDLDAMAEDRYLALGVFRVSPDENLLAYSTDRDGAELYELRFRDLESGEDLPDRIAGTAREAEWASDGETFFYVTRDKAHRPHRVYRHRLGTDNREDVLVFEEKDERFFLSLQKTRSQRFLLLILATHSTTEIHVIDAESPEEPPRCIARRQKDIEWELEHWHGDVEPRGEAGRGESGPGGFFFLRTNLGAPLGRLLKVPIEDSAEDPDAWEEVIPERRSVVLNGVDAFRNHLVLSVRRDGLSGLEIRPLVDGALDPDKPGHRVKFKTPLYTVAAIDNELFTSDWLRLAYQSPLDPRSIFDYNVRTGERRLLKRTEVKGFQAELYTCRRLMIPSADGTAIPVSLIERKDREPGGPLLVYAYGSYGTSLEPRFSIARLSLLDRGFAMLLVHARGGGEMGRPWYEAAKLADKPKTFEDVVAAAEFAVREGLSTPRGLAIRGGSAGGLMVGAVINSRPDLFHTAIADVPFVDVLHTMLDPSIPLTVIEFEEWGNPGEDVEAYDCIASYSPYENVRPAHYPHLLATAGFNDTRVQYWEPAKWVARLRETKKDRNLLLFRVEMGSGHVGASGRYNSLREEAFKLAFLLHSLEIERRD